MASSSDDKEEWINMPSRETLCKMRNIRALERDVWNRRRFVDDTRRFIIGLKSVLIETGFCHVRKRGTWDNKFLYRITDQGRKFKVYGADWHKISRRLVREGYHLEHDDTVIIVELTPQRRQPGYYSDDEY